MPCPKALDQAVVGLASDPARYPTHVFITTWMRNATEAENIRVNAAMVRNLLSALSLKKTVRHVALVTGLKHYLGPFEAYAQSGTLPETPLQEAQPRLPVEIFTMPRKTRCMSLLNATGLPGRYIGHIP